MENKKYKVLWVYPESKETFKAAASLNGKGIADYFDDISKQVSKELKIKNKNKNENYYAFP